MFFLIQALGCPNLHVNDCPLKKAAHRRTVKLVHPDILGPDSGDLQVDPRETQVVMEVSISHHLKKLKKSRGMKRKQPEPFSFENMFLCTTLYYPVLYEV